MLQSLVTDVRERNRAAIVRLLPREHALAAGHPVEVCVDATGRRVSLYPCSRFYPPRRRAGGVDPSTTPLMTRVNSFRPFSALPGPSPAHARRHFAFAIAPRATSPPHASARRDALSILIPDRFTVSGRVVTAHAARNFAPRSLPVANAFVSLVVVADANMSTSLAVRLCRLARALGLSPRRSTEGRVSRILLLLCRCISPFVRLRAPRATRRV